MRRVEKRRRRLPDAGVIRTALQRRLKAILVGIALVGVASVSSATTLTAQSVTITGPIESPMRTITPLFTVRPAGFGTSTPFTVNVQVSTSADFSDGILLDTSIVTSNAVVNVQTIDILPSDVPIYWRAEVSTPDGKRALSTVMGPRQTMPWLQLLAPFGSQESRRPVFRWRAPTIAGAAGSWRFEFAVLSQQSVELQATLLNDTVFIPPTDLQANTSYRWRVRATTPRGRSVELTSATSFIITDPALPTTTIIYQNFPNPFPSAAAFATCFWFDVGEPGANISLDVLDLRGNIVRTIVPGSDGIVNFPPGTYGRGLPGVGNNCSNRFVWNGTARDGRTVSAGTYLLRFIANGGAPVFKKIVFLGR